MSTFADILAALPDLSLIPYGMPMFATPRGLVPLPLLTPEERDTVGGMTPYGGATIGGAVGADGAEYTSFDARTHSDNDFRFHVVKLLSGVYTDIPLQVRCTGRGNLWDDHLRGIIMWSAWEKDTFFTEPVPGAYLPASSGGQTPPPSPGGPGRPVYLNPARGIDSINGQTFTGSQQIDLVSLFSLPGPLYSAEVRLTVASGAPDVKARLGGDYDAWQMTPTTPAPGVSASGTSTIYPMGGRVLNLSVKPDGAQAQVWLNLIAYTPQ